MCDINPLRVYSIQCDINSFRIYSLLKMERLKHACFSTFHAWKRLSCVFHAYFRIVYAWNILSCMFHAWKLLPCFFHAWNMHESVFYAWNMHGTCMKVQNMCDRNTMHETCMKRNMREILSLLNHACYMHEVPHYIILIRSSCFADLKVWDFVKRAPRWVATIWPNLESHTKLTHCFVYPMYNFHNYRVGVSLFGWKTVNKNSFFSLKVVPN